jgi:tetratricopeptide (TPR) repeat protein
MRIERLSSIPPMPPPVRLVELHEGAPAPKQRYVDRLLRAVLLQGAAHAQLVLVGSHPWTRYLVDGRWQPARILPAGVATKLATELRLLVGLGDSSCPQDGSHTFRIHIPGMRARLFRAHHQPGMLLLSPIEAAWASMRTEIIDRHRRLEQERLVVRGELALAEGDMTDAVAAFRGAIELAEGIERPAWLTRLHVQMARCYEAAGEVLRAESAYKQAIAIIEERYGREDAQRMRLFSSLARCADRRGDREVQAMWLRRARGLADLLLDGC